MCRGWFREMSGDNLWLLSTRPGVGRTRVNSFLQSKHRNPFVDIDLNYGREYCCKNYSVIGDHHGALRLIIWLTIYQSILRIQRRLVRPFYPLCFYPCLGLHFQGRCNVDVDGRFLFLDSAFIFYRSLNTS